MNVDIFRDFRFIIIGQLIRRIEWQEWDYSQNLHYIYIT
jgi:hypothetical protein